jgi:hypothetical protein
MDLDVVANRSAFAIVSDRKMSGFQNQPPGGPGTAAADSEPDPVVEADGLALSKIRSMWRWREPAPKAWHKQSILI